MLYNISIGAAILIVLDITFNIVILFFLTILNYKLAFVIDPWTNANDAHDYIFDIIDVVFAMVNCAIHVIILSFSLITTMIIT